MIYCFLADGFEEIEALATVDILRRAGLAVKTVGVMGDRAVGSHGIDVAVDIPIDQLVLDDSIEAVILPGGMPGTKHLDQCEQVRDAVSRCIARDTLVCAICAAPSVLGHMGVLAHRRATCYPGFESELLGATYTGERVTVDGNIITAKGAGCAYDFGFAIVERLCSKKVADDVAASMMC